ncbi:FecR family protein [Membranihabitans maritimus]|uniref:FecR family protein n=1 Tax=Membranihabitans maritimus TaxID=2904244 RepID=UPI001F190EF4|nr:FecR domain-containing protein [Membranihabitans maritimus]
MDKNTLLDSLLNDPKFRDWVEKDKNAEYWDHWKKNHPENIEILEDARAIILGLPVNLHQVDNAEIDKHFDALKEKRNQGKERKIRSISRGWFKYAAAAAILLFVGLYFLNDFTSSDAENVQLAESTAPGQIKSIALPDSSMVVMNGNTKMQFSSNADRRNLSLDGEAHFTVKKVKGQSGLKKFVIETPDLAVEVLGTVFSVSNDSIWTTVVLEEGKVMLRGKTSEDDSYIMRPGEKVVFNKLDHSFAVEEIDAVGYNSWTSKKLSLVNRSVRELVRWFDHNYSIKLHIPEEYSDRELTGTVDLNNSETAVKMIAVALGLQPERKSENIWYFN